MYTLKGLYRHKEKMLQGRCPYNYEPAKIPLTKLHIHISSFDLEVCATVFQMVTWWKFLPVTHNIEQNDNL